MRPNSVSETGCPYVQHRGGPPGFVRVLDDATIGWAEFVGNHLRLFEVAERPDLALLLAVDGYPGRIERLALVTVEGLDWNCPQHITPRFTTAELETTSFRRQL